jgi:hypothetical protein
MNIRKTQRKNKTKQVIVWPSHDTYFTIDTLIESNNHMLTTSGSDITLRVRLNKAVTEENLVAVIGQRKSGKGRPQLVFAMRPVKQTTVDKASTDGISVSMTKVMPVMEITNQTTATPTVTSVTNITTAVPTPTVNA